MSGKVGRSVEKADGWSSRFVGVQNGLDQDWCERMNSTNSIENER